MADGDELRINASLDGDLANALGKISDRIDALDRKLDELGATGKAVGESVADGAEKGAEGLRKEEAAAKGAADALDQTGKAGKDSATGSTEAGKAAKSAAEKMAELDRSTAAAARKLRESKQAADTFARGMAEVSIEAGKAARNVDDAGDKAATSGVKAAAAASGWNRLWRAIDQNERITRRFAAAQDAMKWSAWSSRASAFSGAMGKVFNLDWDGISKKADKASKALGGMSRAMSAIKFGAMIGGVYALIGLLSALGAGAVGAVGGILSMVPAVGAVAGAALAGGVAMMALKAALKEAGDSATALKKNFDFASDVLDGGMDAALKRLAVDTEAVGVAFQHGMGKVGGALAVATGQVGTFAKQGTTINRVTQLFGLMAPVIERLGGIVVHLADILMSLFIGVMPVAQKLAADIDRLTGGFAGWMAQQETSGRITAVVQKAYEGLSNALETVYNIGGSVYQVLKIAAQESSWMGESIQVASGKLYDFTHSIEGQNQIRDYFQQAMPAVRETMGLIGDLTRLFGGMAVNQDLAPTIAMIRDQLVPALSKLVADVGPGMIQFLTTLAQIISGLDFSSLSLLIDVLNGLANAVLWAQQNLPGFNFALSALIFLMIAGGPAFKIISGGAAAFAWMSGALKVTNDLSGGQKVLANAIGWLRTSFLALTGAQTVMGGVAVAARAMWVAITGPIGLIVIGIMLVIGIFLLLWFKCQWFRDAIMTAVHAIGDFFVWLWGIVGTALSAIGDFFVWLWGVVVDAFSAIGQWISDIWTNNIAPVFDAIWTVIKFIGAIIFTLLVAPFLIAFNLISAAVTWWWENVTKPVFQAVGDIFVWLYENVVKPIGAGIAAAWQALGDALEWVRANVIQPMIDGISTALNWLYLNVFTPIGHGIQVVWQALGDAIEWVRANVIQPVIDGLSTALNWLYLNVFTPIGHGIQVIWEALGAAFEWVRANVIQPVFDGISTALTWLHDNVFGPIGAKIQALWWSLGNAMAWVRDRVIQPVFDAITGGLEWVRDRFTDIVNGIQDIWGRLRGALAKPVNFLINTVWNEGILKAWNWAASTFGLPTAAPMAPIPENKEGGIMPGYTPGRDNQLSWVSGGEAIMRPEWTRAMGPAYVHEMNQAARMGGVEAVRRRAMRRGQLAPWEKAYGGDRANPGLAFADGGIVGSGQSWAKSQEGKPYIWGGVGPVGYDCSGAMSALTNFLLGTPINSRRFTTASFGGNRGAGGFVPGRGTFTIGVSTNTGDGVGHMAGSLGNLNVESRGSDGFVTGSNARGAVNPLFPMQFFLPFAGDKFEGSAGSDGGGGWFDWKTWVRDSIVAITDPLINLLPGAPPDWLGAPKGVAVKGRDTMLNWLFSKEGEFGGDTGGVMGIGDQAVRAAVQAVATMMGWGAGAQWEAIDKIVSKESSWDPTALNPTSSAAGLFQKMQSAHGPVERDVPGQAMWGLNYIKQRYGTPTAAWDWHTSHNWYDDGGMLPPGPSLVMNGTGKPEPVFTSGQWDMLDPTRYLDVIGSQADSVAPRHEYDGQTAQLASAVDGLATMLMERPPALAVSGEDTAKAVYDALAKRDREQRTRDRYNYGSN